MCARKLLNDGQAYKNALYTLVSKFPHVALSRWCCHSRLQVVGQVDHASHVCKCEMEISGEGFSDVFSTSAT